MKVERARVFENVFTVLSVSLFIAFIIRVSIDGMAAFSDIVKANHLNLLFALVFMFAAFAMHMKAKE